MNIKEENKCVYIKGLTEPISMLDATKARKSAITGFTYGWRDFLAINTTSISLFDKEKKKLVLFKFDSNFPLAIKCYIAGYLDGLTDGLSSQKFVNLEEINFINSLKDILNMKNSIDPMTLIRVCKIFDWDLKVITE